MDQFRSHTAPAVLREGGDSSVPVPLAVEATTFPEASVDRPEYFEFFHQTTPEERVGFPTPRYWARFAGRLPPRTVLKRLHSDTAKERLVTRLASSKHHVHHDPLDRPDQLVDADDAVVAAHSRQLRGAAPVYVHQDPPTRAASEDRETQVEDNKTGKVDAREVLGRFFVNRVAVSRAQRVLAARHLLKLVHPTTLFGSAFFCLKDVRLSEQLTVEAEERLAAFAWEYELRLHGENYASLVLGPLEGQKAIRRGCLLSQEVAEMAADAEMVLREYRNQKTIPTTRDFFGNEHASLLTALDCYSDHVEQQVASTPFEPGLLNGPSKVPPAPSQLVPRRVVEEMQKKVLERPRGPGSPPLQILSRPLDVEEVQAQQEWGLDMTALNDEEHLHLSKPSVEAEAAAPFDRTGPLHIPSEWGGHMNDDPSREVWGTDFATGGGFVDLDSLRRQGERGACVQPPSVRRAANAPCVICELDADDLISCPCGNGVHEDCGVSIDSVLRCCRTCSHSKWESM